MNKYNIFIEKFTASMVSMIDYYQPFMNFKILAATVIIFIPLLLNSNENSSHWLDKKLLLDICFIWNWTLGIAKTVETMVSILWRSGLVT